MSEAMDLDPHAGFAEFWAAWPEAAWKVPERELDAKRAYCKLAPGAETHAAILRALEIHKNSQRWEEPEYIPAPANWIMRRRWNDDPQQYPPSRRAVKIAAAQSLANRPEAEAEARRKIEELAAQGSKYAQEWLARHRSQAHG